MTIPLFEKYPALEDRIAWTCLGNYPTPVHSLEKLGKKIGYDNIWIKRDDWSSDIYGGNKVRKLEFVLPDALRHKKTTIITYGGIGTNHGLATTIHGRRLGLKTILVLIDQPLIDHVQENLLLDRHFGAELCYAKDTAGAVLKTIGLYLSRQGLYFLPPGGSSVLGALGYVNAAFELKKQVDSGELHEPEYIFVALGSKGTMAGLLLGCRLAGMKTQIIGVRVSAYWIANEKNTARLASDMSSLLHKYDKTAPRIVFKAQETHVIHGFFGEEYGRPTAEGQQAVDLIWKTEKIKLELTYTAKTFAAMLDFIEKHSGISNAPILFWNTYNGVDFTPVIMQDHDFTKLPGDLQWCFEKNMITCLGSKEGSGSSSKEG